MAALCASSSQLRSVLDDHVWSRLLRQDYGVEERVSPAGEALESFRWALQHQPSKRSTCQNPAGFCAWVHHVADLRLESDAAVQTLNSFT